MEALARAAREQLDRGTLSPELLARIGDAEPESSARSLEAAAAEPALAGAVGLWLPELLRSARPGYGAEALRELAAGRRATGAPPLGRELDELRWLPRVLGSSNFLARWLLRTPDAVEELRGDPPPGPGACPASEWPSIREAKYRGLLRIAARDLAGRPFAASLRELSDLADGCLAAGLACAAAETGVEAPSLMALGKLGGRELNFSSDVDLLFVYDAPPGSADAERNAEVARLVRCLKAGLEQAQADGFAYRVDLDLRPEGPQGPLANSVDAALGYYESFGHGWERQMLIRLRAVAGPEAAARAFADAIAPFVFPRHVDPDAPRTVRAMKQRIEDERRRAGRDLEVELKEGPGGIRDVEFLVQALQLFQGGRDPAIRTGNVLEALALLARSGLLPEAAAAELAQAYTWLRRAEHALQMVEERQTQRFPRDRPGQLGLARRMGFDDEEGERARGRLLDEWTTVRTAVRYHFDALVLGDDDARRA